MLSLEVNEAIRCTLIQTGTESYRFQAIQDSLFSTPK
jgi:hypothetical protein